MTRLAISKATEAKIISTIWHMGAESLCPHDYMELERIIKVLCETRSIDNTQVGVEHSVHIKKDQHDSDCAIFNAPAMLPEPCNCNTELTITQLLRSPSKLRAALKSGDVRIVWKDQKPGGRVIESAIVKREVVK